jgi:tRNA G18 (ribose-2'-O)-methylase SpoU
MESITGHKIHHNVMMHGIRPTAKSLDDLGGHIIMLDELSKTDNVGSIARSAAALGVNSFIAPSSGPHPYGRRALRVSMGYASRLDIYMYDDIVSTLKQLKARGYRLYAAEAMPHSTPLRSLKTATDKWVLLMGHEQLGIAPEVLDLCDETLMIEMAPDVKSFNVAIAASILMYRLLY